MYSLITCIVEKGKAEGIIQKALTKGAPGATYFDAKGKGVREKLGLAGMFIKEDKEVMLIVVKDGQVDEIFDIVINAGGLNEKGKGFAYVHQVDRTVGFVD
jgi:nitrogen regulatory protein PII